jgi:hypothetical protein
MWIGDVGQDQREEIDLEPAGTPGGSNYGWRCYEGSLPYNTDSCGAQSEYVFPVYEYSHDEVSCWSVTGGFRYRGNVNTGMTGKYYFADYCNDIIWSLHDSAGSWAVRTEGTFPGNSFSSFGEDRNGELYIAGLSGGKIFRLADTSATGIGETANPNVKIWTGNGNLHVSLISEEGDFEVSIFNLNGKGIYFHEFRGRDAVISTKGYSPGLYVVQVRSLGGNRRGNIRVRLY